MVSCQFVMHYLFEKESSALNVIENFSNRLCKRGYVILTIPDACVIVKKLREKGEKKNGSTVYENEYFSIKADNLSFPKD